MNDAQVFLLAFWSFLMMALGYGFEYVQNNTLKNDFLDFFFNVIPFLMAILLSIAGAVHLIKLVIANL